MRPVQHAVPALDIWWTQREIPANYTCQADHPKQHGTMEKQHDKTSRRPSNILTVKWYLLRSLKQCVSGWANQHPCLHREDIIQNKCKHEVVVAYTIFKHRIELKGGCSTVVVAPSCYMYIHTHYKQTNLICVCCAGITSYWCVSSCFQAPLFTHENSWPQNDTIFNGMSYHIISTWYL